MKEKHGFYVYPSTLDSKDPNLKFFSSLAKKLNEDYPDVNPKTIVRAYFTFRNGGVEDFCNYAIDTYNYYKTEFQTNPNLSSALAYFTRLVEKYGFDYVVENVDKFPSSIRVVLKFLDGGMDGSIK